MAVDEYAMLGREIGVLVSQKQAAYGDSFGRSGAVLRALYPDGIPSGGMDDLLTITRMVDKLFRIATAGGQPDPGGEDPWMDIVGYALLAIVRRRHAVEDTGGSVDAGGGANPSTPG